MDFESAKCHDFDLNIQCAEVDLDLNAEISPLIDMNNRQASQNFTEGTNTTAANNANMEVHQSSEVKDTNAAGLAILADSASGASFDAMMNFQPKYVAALSLTGRRRYRRRGLRRPNDPNRFCTNFDCRTRKTPLWRRGPLGPKTLCNACGIYYKKQVTGAGSGIPAIAVYGDASAPPSDDGGSFSSVPAETVKGGFQKGR